MSVEVKTPTKEQFDHRIFPCGERSTTSVDNIHGQGQGRLHQHDGAGVNDSVPEKPSFQRQASNPGQNHNQGKIHRKRRASERIPDTRGTSVINKGRRHSNRFGKTTGDKIVLPTKFLLGGNINDPLNLNSLCDEEVNKALNESTPQSSPIPTPARRQQVHVLIPPNISDPLGLNSEQDPGLVSPGSKKKRSRHKNRKRSSGQGTDGKEEEKPDFSKPMHIVIGPDPDITGTEQLEGSKARKAITDKIVSPVIPQRSPKLRKRRRTHSEGSKPEPSSEVSRSLLRMDSNRSTKSDQSTKISPYTQKTLSQSSQSDKEVHVQPKYRRKDAQFIYGNYNRYYGYRNPGPDGDPRLKILKPEWFVGRTVLDIGCNVGHLTLAVARAFLPYRIVGMDIDGKLIGDARKNVRHYISKEETNTGRYPVSVLLTYGPLAAPPVPSTDKFPVFPNNVAFVQGNYVLERDELLDLQVEEYDTILCLSITKWIHLNWGDTGIKRCFKRMYRQLKPGGKLILEPQGWPSYKKKKKLTETIFKNYQEIRLKPDQFTEYLLSQEVGFSTCQSLESPFNKAKGFRRLVLVFTKADTAQSTPYTDPLHSTPKIHAGPYAPVSEPVKVATPKAEPIAAEPSPSRTSV